MPPITKIKKEDIIEKTFEIVKKEGLESVNARRIAKELHCSVQPIFSNFQNMEDLKETIIKKATNYFYEYVIKLFDEDIPPYKQVGINYIKFARENQILFRLLFLDNNPIDIPMFDDENLSYEVIRNYIGISTNLNKKEISDFHRKMWIFTHGLATLIANNKYKITDNEIEDMLSKQFQALMLLEENPNNKWIIKKGD